LTKRLNVIQLQFVVDKIKSFERTALLEMETEFAESVSSELCVGQTNFLKTRMSLEKRPDGLEQLHE
jgi:hypothetical protein